MQHRRELARAIGVAARNVIRGSNLRAWRLLTTHPKALAFYSTEAIFLLDAVTESKGLIQKNVFEVLEAPADLDVHLAELNRVGVPWFNPLGHDTVDIVSLCLLCKILKPRVVFEIGTFNGYTALHLALNAPDARVFTLDLPLGPGALQLTSTVEDARIIELSRTVTRQCYDGYDCGSRVTQLYGDSAAYDFAPYRDAVDLFFIDGSHSYDYVKSDTLNAVACVRRGGVIAWHDFGRTGINGVSRWLREFALDRPVYCVPGGSLAFALIE